MSSLLGSIFGGGSEDKDTPNQGLFANSKALPERPHHKPKDVALPKKSKRDNKDDSKKKETSDKGIDDGSKLQKRRKKKRKSRSSDDTDGGKVDDENNKEVTEKDAEKEMPDKEERTIFVGNLPLTTTRKTLASLFKDCGTIASCRIRSVPVTGIKLPQDQAGNQRMMRKVCVNTNQIDSTLTDSVQGYVVFKNVNDVEKALELNNKLDLDGMKIRVDRSKPTVDPSRSVFVGNLPYGSKESTLQEHFEKGCLFEPGDITGVRIIRDSETFQCKGFGYILFREKNAVPTALKLHDSTYMKKKIRVMVCGKRFKGRRGEASQPKQKVKQAEKMSVGAFRRIIAKQQKDALVTTKRKRGEKKKNVTAKKAGAGGVSKRAALDKKVDKKVKKLQKRLAKGMGKNKR